ncbi:hypothetical protein Tco_0757731 [Tanacetum coccineum]
MKVRENDKPSAQLSRFLKMFKQLRLEIGLKDALVEMPKFNKWLSSLLRNKRSSKRLPSQFLMLYVPLFIYELSSEMLRRSRENFLSNFNFEPDPRVPIILGRPFLRTAKALIDLYEETLTLRIGKEELVYYADKSEKNKVKHSVHAISIIYFLKDDPFSGSTTIPSDSPFPDSSLMKTSDSTFEEFIDEFTLLTNLPRVEDKDVEIKSSSSFTLTSPKESEFEAYCERDSIPLVIDLTLPPTLEVSSRSYSILSPERSEIPIDTIIMPIRITFDNPIDFNDHFSKPKDFKKDLTVTLDSTESSILPPPLLDSDSPLSQIAESLWLVVALNSLREGQMFISSETLLVFKEPPFLLPPPEPPDECLNFEPILVMKNVVL